MQVKGASMIGMIHDMEYKNLHNISSVIKKESYTVNVIPNTVTSSTCYVMTGFKVARQHTLGRPHIYYSPFSIALKLWEHMIASKVIQRNVTVFGL